MPRSEGYGWRSKPTGQEQAAAAVINAANSGDRIASWHDGTIYALRVAGLEKRIQIQNAAASQICPDAMQTSMEWAVITKQEPPSPSQLDTQLLSQAPWKLMGTYGNNLSEVYQATTIPDPLVIESELFDRQKSIPTTNASSGHALRIKDTDTQPAYWGCSRLLPFGKQQAIFRIKPTWVPNYLPDDTVIARIEYSGYPFGEYSDRLITLKELRQSSDWQEYSLALEHQEINRTGEFRLSFFRESELLLDTITVSKLSD
jgi:hypothetical protein